MALFTKLFKSKPIFLAPMFEVTNLPYRLFCKEQGANAAVTEFISVNQLLYVYKNSLEQPRNLKYQLQTDDCEKPVGLQLFGFQADHFKELSLYFDVQEHGFDFLDLNIGCPVPKICNIGAGSKLLDSANLPKLEQILKTIKNSFPDTPFSIKIRAGYKRYLDFEKFAELLNSLDLLHVTIHPKLAVSPKDTLNIANHELSKEFVELVDHPVIINGGIQSLNMAEDLLNQTGGAGAMIGRQAQKFPWVFNNRFQQAISTKEYIQGLSHFLDLNKQFGFGKLYMVRDQLLGMMRGFPGSKHKRQELQHKLESIDELITFTNQLEGFFERESIERVKNIVEKRKLAVSSQPV